MACIIIVAAMCVCFLGNPKEDSDDSVFHSNEENIQIENDSYHSPDYPVYVRTIGPGSIGCEYGYCVKGAQDETEILMELGKMSGFHFNNNYSEDVALFYSEEPKEIKLYYALEGETDYEEYAFAGEDYDYPYGAEEAKYVIRVPETYGMHYFFAVISWEDGREDFMYFSMENKYNPPSEAEYNSVTINSCMGTGATKNRHLKAPIFQKNSFLTVSRRRMYTFSGLHFPINNNV